MKNEELDNEEFDTAFWRQVYKNCFAGVNYDKTADYLTERECNHIRRLFNSFAPEYHPDLALYPAWLSESDNWRTFLDSREQRRVREFERKSETPYFLYSHPRISRYLDLEASKGHLYAQRKAQGLNWPFVPS